MADYRELTEEDIEKLRMLLRSSAWNDVMKPALLGRYQVLAAQLVLDPNERGEKGLDDATIRGGIKQIQWLLTKFDQVVEEFDHNRRVDERDAALAAASP